MADKRNIIGFEGPESIQERAEALRPHVKATRLAGKNASLSDVYRYAMDYGLAKLEREAAKVADDTDEVAA